MMNFLRLVGVSSVWVFWKRNILFVELLFLVMKRNLYFVFLVVIRLIWVGRLVLVLILCYMLSGVFCE